MKRSKVNEEKTRLKGSLKAGKNGIVKKPQVVLKQEIFQTTKKWKKRIKELSSKGREAESLK